MSWSTAGPAEVVAALRNREGPDAEITLVGLDAGRFPGSFGGGDTRLLRHGRALPCG